MITIINQQPSDNELVALATAGDETAFTELHRRYERAIYAICLRMTQNPADAEDLTQETFAQLYRTIGSFRGESSFRTWLHRIAVNQVLMCFRKRKCRPEFTTDEEHTPVQIQYGTEHHDRMPIIDRIALNRAIEKLPNGFRTIFILKEVEGYEHDEIARLLECSAGNSKSQLSRAKAKLRDSLAAIA